MGINKLSQDMTEQEARAAQNSNNLWLNSLIFSENPDQSLANNIYNSASQAANSAVNAKSSETNAGNSASQAVITANNAKTSELNAANSAALAQNILNNKLDTTTYNAQVINAGNSNAEIVDARGNYPKLGDRIIDLDNGIQKFYGLAKSGKKICMVGDSTTDQNTAPKLFDRLNEYAATGGLLDGATFINRGLSGKTLNDFLNNVGSMTLSQALGDNADLYVISYGINDIRGGINSPGRTEAQVKSDLKYVIDTFLTQTKGYILLRTPNTFLNDNNSANYFDSAANIQKYCDQLYEIYESFRGYDKRLDVLDIPNRVFGRKISTVHPLMLNGLHPNDNGYRAIADEIAECITQQRKTLDLNNADFIIKCTIDSTNSTSSKLVVGTSSFNEEIKVGDTILLGSHESFIVSSAPQYINNGEWSIPITNVDYSKFGVVRIVRKTSRTNINTDQITVSNWCSAYIPAQTYNYVEMIIDLQSLGLSGSPTFACDFKYYTDYANLSTMQARLFFNNTNAPNTITGGTNISGFSFYKFRQSDVTILSDSVQFALGSNRYLHFLVQVTKTDSNPIGFEIGDLNLYINGAKVNTDNLVWYLYNAGTGATITPTSRRGILATKKYVDSIFGSKLIDNQPNNWNYGSINSSTATTVYLKFTLDLITLGLSGMTSFNSIFQFLSKNTNITSLFTKLYFSNSPTSITPGVTVTGATISTSAINTMYTYNDTQTVDAAGNRYMHILVAFVVNAAQKITYEAGNFQVIINGVSFNVSGIYPTTYSQEAGSFIKNGCFQGDSTISYRDFVYELMRLGILNS